MTVLSKRVYRLRDCVLFVFIALLVSACVGETDVELLKKAEDSIGQGDDRTAIIHLKNSLQKNVNNYTARKLLGELYVTYKDGVGAEKELSKAREINSSDNGLVLSLAQAQVYQRKYNEAIELLAGPHAFTREQSSRLNALQGSAWLGLKEMVKAEAHFHKALKQQPGFLAARIGMARLNSFRKKFDKAKKALKQIVSDQHDSIEAWVLLGEIAFEEKNFKEAGDNFKAALEYIMKLPVPTEEFYVRSRYANTLIVEEDFDEGLMQVNKLLRLGPDNPVANYLRGNIAFRQKDFSTAREHLQVVLKHDPAHKQSTLLLGAVNFGQGQFEQADRYLKSVLNEDPTNTLARKWLSATMLKLNQPEQAMALINSGLKASPEDPQFLELGSSVALSQGDSKKAVNLLKQALEEAPDSQILRTKLASTWLRMGEYDAAIKELEAGSGPVQSDFRSQALLIMGYAQKKDFSAAVKLANLLIEKMPDRPAAKHILAQVYLVKGESETATNLYADILKRDQNYIPALLNLAKIEFGNKKLDSARAYLEKILELQPKNTKIILAYAHVLDKSGDDKLALQWIETARVQDKGSLAPRLVLARYYMGAGQIREAEKALSEASAISEKNPGVISLQGHLALHKKQGAIAEGHFKRLTRLQPENAEAFFYLAQASAANKKTSQARQSLNTAIKLKPDFTRAQWSLAQLEIKNRQYKAAKKLIGHLKQKHPASSISEVLQADLYFAKKNYPAALKIYKKTYAKEKTRALMQRQYRVLVQLNKPERSRELLTEWLSDHEKDQQSRVTLALSYQKSGQAKEAVTVYKKALEFRKSDPGLLNNIAWLLFELGDKEALDYAERAHDLAPDHAAIADTLGWISLQNGKHEAGLNVLKKAIGKAPNEPDIRYHYAVALHKNGNTRAAREELDKLAKIDKPYDSLESVKKFRQELAQ